MTFYNEFDAQKAAWLRELMNAGEITTGAVDERSIKDLGATELTGYGRLHFFAGIGVWDYALRLAEWPADWPIWTASCPCQPFSAAGRRGGTEDDRHLWPWLIRLIAERRPYVVIGEQVSSADGLGWLDSVRRDLEAAGYACGALDTCAAGVGAPHLRQRLYWCGLRIDGLADYAGQGLEGGAGTVVQGEGVRSAGDGAVGGLANVRRSGLEGWQGESGDARGQHEATERSGDALRLGHNPSERRGEAGSDRRGPAQRPTDAGVADGVGDGSSARPLPGTYARLHRGEDGARPRNAELERSGFTSGFWRDADWILTRPQRVGDLPGLRPVEPGALPLADGAPARVGRLRGYGDAIVAQQAAAFVRCVMEEIEAAR